jgi:mRNA-degrading endonuclease toxin of MazEF toxin-antitoxin module
MSVVNLDNILTVPVELLTEPVTVLRPEKMREVERAIHFALALSD